MGRRRTSFAENGHVIHGYSLFQAQILRLGQLSGVLHALVSQYKHKPDAARIGINQWFSDDSSQSQEKVPLTALDPICDLGNRYTVQLAVYDEIGKTAGLRHIGLHISQRFFEVFIATETSQELEKLFDFLINELALETTESPRGRMLRLLDEPLTSEQAKVPSNARPTTAHDLQQRILVFLVELERLINRESVGRHAYCRKTISGSPACTNAFRAS